MIDQDKGSGNMVITVPTSNQYQGRDLANSRGWATPAATHIKKAISSAIKSAEKNRFADISDALTGVREEIHVLRTIAIPAVQKAHEKEKSTTQHLLNDALTYIASMRETQKVLKGNIEASKSALAGDKSASSEAQKTLKKHEDELKPIEAKIREVREDRKKMAEFFWVPFYNAYLAGKNISNLIVANESKLRDLVNKDQKEIDHYHDEIAQLQKDIEKHEKEVQDNQSKIDDLQKKITSYEAKNKGYAANLAAANVILDFLVNIDDALDGLKGNMDDVRSLERRMSENVDVASSDGHIVSVSVPDAVVKMAQMFDDLPK